jgi:hypothetical protein
MNKYEQLIDLIINESEDEARKLFHSIVVEKSREIYESLIDEEDFDEGFGHDKHDEVTSLVDEVDSDEDMQAMHEEEEFDIDSEDMPVDDEMGDDEFDMGDDEFDMGDDGAGEEELEDRVVDLEDALDELKAEFDRLMADEAGEEEHSDEKMDMDSEEDDEEEELAENFTRNKRVVKEYVTPVKHDFSSQRGESGQMAGTGAHSEKQGGRNKTSVVANPNKMGGTAVTSKGGNQDQDGTKPVKASNEYTKGEGNLPGSGKFANVAGKDAGHSAYSNKASVASPKQGETNTKSPLGRK